MLPAEFSFNGAPVGLAVGPVDPEAAVGVGEQAVDVDVCRVFCTGTEAKSGKWSRSLRFPLFQHYFVVLPIFK